MKLLKKDLRKWNNGVFNNVEAQVDKLSKQIEMLDTISEGVELNETKVTLRRKCFWEMWDILRSRKVVWKQKLRNT